MGDLTARLDAQEGNDDVSIYSCFLIKSGRVERLMYTSVES